MEKEKAGRRKGERGREKQSIKEMGIGSCSRVVRARKQHAVHAPPHANISPSHCPRQIHKNPGHNSSSGPPTTVASLAYPDPLPPVVKSITVQWNLSDRTSRPAKQDTFCIPKQQP